MLQPSIISGASQEKLMEKHRKAVYIEMQKLLGLFGDQSQISIFIKPKSMPDIKKKLPNASAF